MTFLRSSISYLFDWALAQRAYSLLNALRVVNPANAEVPVRRETFISYLNAIKLTNNWIILLQ
jgi:hypothetical protein